MTEPRSSGQPQNISRETMRGTFWGYLSFASGKLLNFVATLILARLLVPEQFGLIAYCTIVIQYLDIVNSAGIGSALVARKDKVEEAANSAFLANIFLGFVSYGVAYVAAPAIASFFKTDEIIPLIRVLALVLPAGGLGVVPSAMILRGLRFRTKVIPNLARNLTKGIISIVLAMLGFGVWSLVWSQIAGEVIATIVLWWLAAWKPSWKFDRSTTLEVLTFGLHIISVDLAGQIQNNVDYIIIGRLLGATLLGIYTFAYRVPELAIRSFDTVIGGVLFPLLAQVQADNAFLKKAFLSYIRYISLFTFAIGIGTAIISRLFVETFLSAKWNETILPMAFLSIALAIMSVGHIPGIFYKAIGRPDILNIISIVKLPFIVGIVWYATNWGIVGVSIGQIGFAIFSILLESLVFCRIIEFNVVEIAMALFPAVACSIAMSLTTIPVMYYCALTGLSGLLIITFLGGLTFIAALSVFDSEMVLRAVKFLRNKLVLAEKV